MHKWKVTETAAMTFGRGNFGYGFNIVNEDGRPVVTFMYDEDDDATAAARQVSAALSKAWLVRGHNRF